MDAARLIVGTKKYLVSGSTETYRRLTDAAYLLVGVVIFIGASVVLFAARDSLDWADFDAFRSIEVLPGPIAALLRLVTYAGTLVAVPVAVMLSLLARQLILARNLAAGGFMAWFLARLANVLAEQEGLEALLAEVTARAADGTGLGFPSQPVTIATALAAVATSYPSRKLRWASWLVVALVALAAVYASAYFATDVIAGLALGVVAGALANLLLGIPRTKLTATVIKEAFEQFGTPIAGLQRVASSARGSVPYRVTAQDGTEYFVKLMGQEHRNADFFFKVWRFTLLKDAARTAPFLTPQQQAEHEAYLTLLAQKHGARTPDVIFTTCVADGFALLVQEQVAGQTLDTLGAAGASDELLAGIWQQAKLLREAHILHGDLRASNVLIDPQGQPWIIDFGLAEAGADEAALAQDTAQMLASMAGIAGAERAVRSAMAVLGREAVVQAGPRTQALALSIGVRGDLGADAELLDEIHACIEAQTGSEIAEEEILRIRPQHLLWVLGLGAGIYFLLPQIGELGGIIDVWRRAESEFLLASIIASGLTYVASSVALHGALHEQLPFWRTVLANLAASFANRFGPKGVAGAVILERYIENSSIKRRTAITAVTVKTAADLLAHVVALIVFLPLLDLDDMGLLEDIEAWHVAAAVGAGVVILIFLARSPERVRGAIRSGRASVRELARLLREPKKAVQLVGGSVAIVVSYAATLVVSLWAVGVDLPLAQIAAVYLVSEMIGSVSPTPGGLGVVEGAYIATLKAFGVSSEPAVAAVLIYRLVTFWLPILPGLIAFRYLQRKDFL